MAGTITNSCAVVAGTSSNNCAQTNPLLTISVVAPSPSPAPATGYAAPFIPLVSSPATGTANAAYLTPIDYYGAVRTTRDMGAIIPGSSGSAFAIENILPQGISYSVGADATQPGGLLNVQQTGGVNAYYATAAEMVNGGTLSSVIAQQVAAGKNTIYLPGGTYTGWTSGISFYNINGSASQWIRVMPAPGATVSIRGTYSGTGAYSVDNNAVTIQISSYLSVEGINFSYMRNGLMVLSGNHIRFRGNKLSWLSGNAYPIFPIAGVVMNIEYSWNTASEIVHENDYVQGDPSVGWPGGSFITAWYVTFCHNTINNSNGEGLIIAGRYVWAYSNYVRNARNILYYVDSASQVLMEGNFGIEDSSDSAFWAKQMILPFAAQNGIQVSNEVAGSWTGASFPLMQDISLRNNIIVGGRNGLQYSGYSNGQPLTNFKAVNNTFLSGGANLGFSSSAMLSIGVPAIGTHSGVVIENNIFKWVGSGSGNTYIASPTGIMFGYNLWDNVQPGSAAGIGDNTGNAQLIGY